MSAAIAGGSIERIVLEYALNAAWQVPLLAGTAWLFIRAARLGPLAEHRLWLGVLAACLLLPVRGVELPVAASPAAALTATQSMNADWPAPVIDEPANEALAVSDELPKQPATLHLRIGELRLSERSMRLWASLYGSVVGLALLRMGRGWLAAHRLLNASERYAMDEAEANLLPGVSERMHVRLPQVRVSRKIESPVLVGVLRPVLLLPQAFAQCAQGERRAALCHELAHLQRRDCLTNALCQWLGVPLVWHPVVHGVQTQIARTREMVCDAVAAREMSPDGAAGDGRITYAHCLLGLARRMLGGTAIPSYGDQGLGLFKSNKLEERVMRLTEVKQATSTGKIWMRRVTGAAAMMTAMAGAAFFHLRPVLAEPVASANLMAIGTPPALSALTASTGLPAQHTPQQMSAPPQEPTTMPAVPAAAPAPPEPVMPVAPIVEAPIAPVAPAPAPLAAPTPIPVPAPVAPIAPLAPMSAPMPMAAPAPAPRYEQFGEGGNVAIAHGKKAHVIVQDGDHVHRWTGADGQPFELVNSQSGELTAQQKRDAEAEYARERARAEKEIEKVRRQLESPEFKAQINQFTNGKIQEEMARAQKQVADSMARMNSPEWKAQMDQLTSGKIQEQMATVQKQMAEQMAQFNSPEAKAQRQKQIDEAMAKVNSPEFQKQMEEAARQVKSIDSAEMAKQMAKMQKQMKQVDSPEFKRQMEQVRKQVDEAMQELKRAQEDMEKDQQKDHQQ